MSTGTAVATTERKSVIRVMANRYGMEPDTFENTVRATCMPQGRDVAPMTREEFAAGIMVAENYGLNPILREIYFYPKQGGGIVPVVSIDGWLSLINRRKELDGIEFDELHDDNGKLVSITCRIYRRDRQHPTIVTEHLSECIRDTKPWKMQHRMLRHKALIQCARYAFGFAGIHDEDEAERIVEATAVAVSGPSAPPPPPAEARPQEPATPANANTGPAAPPVEAVEEAEIVEATSPVAVAGHPPAAEGGGIDAQHPPLAQEDPFDVEMWLDEARERFQEAKTAADVDDVHAMFEDTASNELGMVERQKYQDMHEAALARVQVQPGPEQAEVTGEPGPAPDEDEDDIPSGQQPAAPAGPSPAEAYYRRITDAVSDSIRTYDSVAELWRATKPERDALVQDGSLSRDRVKEMQASIKARYAKEFGEPDAQPQAAAPADSGPAAPPAEESELNALDREFRAKLAACQTIEQVGALVTESMVERNKHSGTPQHKEWTELVKARRKQLTGIA